MQKPFLTAEWRKLILANYAVDPAILAPYLPYKTELDFWKEKCYVSLVGFRFINTRLKGLPIPFHQNFEEINLRFYVRYKDGNNWKRGVTFIKEIVPKPALTFVANTIYQEKYVTLPTRHIWNLAAENISIKYLWKHLGSWDFIEVNADPKPLEILPGTEEEFITEHYWGYTPIGNNRSSEYQVEHPRWQTYSIKDFKISVKFGELYGASFGFLKDSIPDSIMLAEGSAIAVRSARKIQ